MTTIGIISDSSVFSNKIEKKLSLLRKGDVFLKYDLGEFNGVRPDTEIILLFSEHKTNITKEFIKKIKSENNYVILFLSEFDDGTLLQFYDWGIDEFCLLDALMSEIIVKIVNGQKLLSDKKVSGSYRDILVACDILKENNPVYKNLETILAPRLMKTFLKASFLAVDVPEESRQKFLTDNLETKMLSVLRKSDIVINYKEYSYLLILTDTSLEKVKGIYEKLVSVLEIKLIGMFLRYKSLKPKELIDKIEYLRLCAQKECKYFVVEEEEESSDYDEKDWLDDNLEDAVPQNYKFFKVMYKAKVEKVIKPVFFRMKEKYEDIPSDVRIRFATNNKLSEFLIFHGSNTDSLKIMFENNLNLIFYLNFGGIYSPENIEFTLPISQLTVKQLTDIVQKFIEEGVKNEINKCG